MKWIGASLVLVLCCSLIGCAGTETDEVPEVPVSAPSTMQDAAAEAFRVPLSDVTAKQGVANLEVGWRVVVILASVESTAAVDRAAAGALAGMASLETSDTPLFLDVLSPDLRFPESSFGWGRLSYNWGWWGRGESFARGSDITLQHVEAQAPSDNTDSGMFLVGTRGHWQDVNVSVLQEWATEGAPEPMVLPDDIVEPH